MHARPVPSNPYNPKSPTTDSSSGSLDQNTIRYPSPFVPIRLPVFAPVLWINDRIVQLLSVGGRRPSSSSRVPAAGSAGAGKRRGVSDEVVESVEEGSGNGGVDAATAYEAAASARRGAMGGIRVNAPGRRKKAD